MPSVTVVVPTLANHARLLDCLASLDAQTLPAVQVVVVDNSGSGRAHAMGVARFRVIENQVNVGFGRAANQGWRLAPADYLAVLNDDAVADPGWLERLVNAMECNPETGMAASCILMGETGGLDSAGMLIARDGSSKQRGHGRPPGEFAEPGEALLPSGCAALYRRRMLDEVGMFDEDFFLYCEDTDLGLRGRWAGWDCIYVPEARVTHSYSQSSGAASALKAWFVERNRLRVCVRCLPLSWLLPSPIFAKMRYFHHLAAMISGRGKAAEFRASGGSGWQLTWLALKAHLDLLISLPRLLRQRARIRRRITPRQFGALLARHRIPLREVASL